MKKMIRLAGFALLSMTIVPAFALAQEAKPAAQEAKATAPTPSERPPKVQVPLRIQLVLSRYQGDKKISSVPYSLFVTTSEGRTSLRMMLQVPVQAAPNLFNMKDVGTNIDCWAEPAAERGVYKVNLVVADSSVLPAPVAVTGRAGDGQQANAEAHRVMFRNFTSTFNILLRDGQTAQYTTATDSVSGEVLKIDATLNVLK